MALETEQSRTERESRPLKTGLKRRLVGTMIAVGTIPLFLAMIISYLQGNKSLTQVLGSSFKALAYETSTKVDLLMDDEFQELIHLAGHPTLFLTLQEQNRAYSETNITPDTRARLEQEAMHWEQGQDTFRGLLRNRGSLVLSNFLRNDITYSDSTQSLYITDAQGVLASSINMDPPFFNKDRPIWQKIMSGKVDRFISNLFQDAKSQNHLFEIAVPLKNQVGSTVGVLHRRYIAKKFFATSIEPIIFGDTGHVMLITSEGVVLDCPILPTGHKLEDPNLVQAVTGPAADWVETRGDGHGGKDLSIIGFSPLAKTNRITESSNGLRWYTFAWQASEEVFAPTQKLLKWIALATFVSALLIAMMGSLAADRIVRPIRRLQKAAELIGKGEDVPELQIHTGDEIELLSEEINTMNALLRKAFTGLEKEVEKKTQEVIYLKKYTESILMSVPEAIAIFDPELNIEYCNQAFEKITDCASEQCIGKKLNDLDSVYKMELEELDKELGCYAVGAKTKAAARAASGNTGYQAKDPLAPSPGSTSFDTQNTIILGDRIFAYQFFDVMLEEETRRRIGLIMKDITQEKKLLDHLAQADKLSGLGTLTAGIAHEMNNPLYSIIGYTEAIVDEKDQQKIKSYAQKVLERARHMASVILNMAGYSRSSEKDPLRDININERIDAAAEIARMASYSDDIVLEKHYSQLPLIKGKPEEIQQVFVNILTNAVQAMQGKGKITIHTARENGSILVRIQDTGPGIPLEYLSKVFDPFFTTKEQGSGTGLGLNIVHRVITNYGGTIDVESSPGKGATFIIRFPVNGNKGDSHG